MNNLQFNLSIMQVRPQRLDQTREGSDYKEKKKNYSLGQKRLTIDLNIKLNVY